MDWQERLAGIGVEIEEHVPIRDLTSFRLGGPAAVVLRPESEEALVATISRLKEEEVPFHILGKGTNVVYADEGFDGALVLLRDNFQDIRVEGHAVYAQAGASLRKVAEAALDASLEGLAFAHGIPGAVGGAVTMNAGAYGGEMKDVIEEVRVLTHDGEVKTFSGEEMHFRYRRSRVEDDGLIVIEAKFSLQPGDPVKIREDMEDLWQRRVDKQPLEYASAGSTFKRPEGYFAGKLIDDAGLRGLRYHDAQVSEKHCGFIINRGHATTEEVVHLIETVRKIVYDASGVLLEPEVKVLGKGAKPSWSCGSSQD